MHQVALEIDHPLCWGCRTCEVACKQEMNAPDGVRLIRVLEDGPKEVEGKLEFVFHVSLCRHCEVPPCVEACPEEAIRKRDDGIVVLDQERCTGCKACIEECPYEAIAFDKMQGLPRNATSAITGWTGAFCPRAPTMCAWPTVSTFRLGVEAA
jgi:Fe-S-cluster-containing dehydrogenase component